MTSNGEMMSRISELFLERRKAGQLAFMPFISAGDPDISGTNRLIEALSEAGADLIEVGFPYSDPIADGPVIQASYTRALAQKISVDQIFEAIAKLPDTVPPLVGMVSYAIVFRHGVDRFLKEASESGFSGLIVPDLPAEEAGEFGPLVRQAGMDLIQLLAPTTTDRRTNAIVEHSSGFIYCIAVAGTTGERERVAEELIEQLTHLKQQTETPLAVGFGLSKPEHLDPLRGVADGAIVGSAIVKYLQSVEDGKATFDEVLDQIRQYATEMADAAHQSAS